MPLIVESNAHIFNVHCVETSMETDKNHCINCHKLKKILCTQRRHSNNTSNLIDSCKLKQILLIKSSHRNNTSHCHEIKKSKLPCITTYLQLMEF